jgi:murein L,D-transpeptidase YcbB/YkuD
MTESRGRVRIARWATLCFALPVALQLSGMAPAWAEQRDDRGAALPSTAAPAVDSALIAAIRILAGDGPGLDQLIDTDAATLRQIYAERDFAPIWATSAGLQPQGEWLLAAMERLHRSGAVSFGADLAGASVRRGAVTPEALAEIEVLLSSALAGAAVDPEDLLAPGPHPQALVVLTDEDLDEALPQWLPPDPAFWRLRAAIGGYQAMVDRGAWPTVGQGPKLEPGMRDPRIIQVRQRLLASGDMIDSPAPPDATLEPAVYDEALAEAIRRFQARHGLATDAVIGRGTIDALNIPVEERLASMLFNLRRLHQKARDWGDDYVMVNIAGAQLTLVQDGETAAFYNVIVGRRERRTPEVHSAINRLEFNPYWNVPSGIYAKDFLPKLRKDSGYLANYKNIKVYRASEPANEVDPSTIDWFSEEARKMRLRLRQDPGPENALGPAKFLFPNNYDVYLHGTNKPSLFAKADRFLSSGCVRLPDPLGFAELLLEDDPAWTRERIEQMVKDGRNRSVTLGEPLPVHLVYDTAWVDESGTVQFRGDVYRRDERESVVAERGGGKG